MAIALDPKQPVSSEELFMSQVASQEAIIRLLMGKGMFAKEDFRRSLEEYGLRNAKKRSLWIIMQRLTVLL